MLNPFRSKPPAVEIDNPHLIVHSQHPYNAEPPTAQLRASFVTPVDSFYVRSHGDIPVIDAAEHLLRVTGRVATDLRLSMEDLRERFPAQTISATMQCAGNRRADMQRVRCTTDIFTAYDTTTQTWTELPPMPAPRDHAGRGLVGNKIYVLGGRSFGHNNTVDTTFAYDIDTRSWSSSLQHMPSSRGGCASATIGELIYTIGGEGNPASGSMGVFSQNEAYNTTSDTWIELAPMDVPRHGTAAVAVNERVYVSGGGLMIGGGPTFFASYYQP